MIIDVIPVKRLPRGIGDTFSYNVAPDIESQIKPGQLVEVDFRNRIIPGLVKALSQAKSQVGLKTVSIILYPSPLVTPQQMRLAKWVANYYFTSLATATKLIVPELPKTRIKNQESRIKNIPRKSASSQRNSATQLIWWDDENTKNQQIIKSINQALKKNQQVLWLFPEKYLTENACNHLTNSLINQSLVCQNYTSKKKNLEQYLNILSNKYKIIIGTRSAIFAPFNNLGLVILEDEANSLYKSPITPRYHTREVAYELAKLHEAKFILTSSAPSLETYHNQNFNKSINQINKQIKIIDIKEERLKANYSSLSEKLQNAIEMALKNHKQVFLFHNRRGQASSVTCKNCGYSILCADCQLPLTHHLGDRLVCHHCRAREDMPPFCPKCSSDDLKLTGKGTQHLETEVKKLFPKIKVLKLDSDTDITHYSLPVTGYDIVIGTEYALSANRVNWTNISVIGVINADTALYRPDFRASERSYQLLIRLQATSYRLQAIFIVQTYNLENKVIQAIAQNKPELFYDEELKLRKALNYPPYQQVIKLIYRNINEKKTVGEAFHIYNRLRKHLIKETTKKYNLEILKPFPAFERMERGKYKFHLILRIPPASPESLYEKIRELVPPDWVFDRDPETLL